MTSEPAELGQRVRAARLAKKWTVEQAARKAEISRVTWARVEEGLGVQDVKRAAVLQALGLDWSGASVGAATQDAVRVEDDFVSAAGDTVEAGITNEDLLREILRSRAEYDQIRAEVRDLSGRVERLEQPRP